METARRDLFAIDVAVVGGLAALLVVIHFAIGNGYGFHRDELQFLDDARHLDWGFVAYPPLTSFCARVAIALFGISPGVLRLPAAVINATTLVLVGLMARVLGGGRLAQGVAVLAAFPAALVFSSLLQYNTFDMLAWTVVVLSIACLLRTGDARWWVGVGAGVGLGVESKYSIAFLVVGLVAGLLVSPVARATLRSRWFWIGVLVAAAIAAPNLIWLVRHGWITVRMEEFIHARDVRHGRADGYFADQLKVTLFAFPLAMAGLVWLVRERRLRMLSVLYLGPLVLLAVARGRGYYLMPAYPILYAAGAVVLERWLAGRRVWVRAGVARLVVVALLAGSGAVAWAYLPIWRVGSAGWRWQMAHNEDMANEVGWPEFVGQVAAVRDRLAPGDRARLAVLANNFGEAGALALYGPGYGLPVPISSTNSFHQRGWGPYEPETVIVVGGELEDQRRNFESCAVVARVWLPDGVRNEETDDHPEFLLCRHLRGSWPAVWGRSQEFG